MEYNESWILSLSYNIYYVLLFFITICICNMHSQVVSWHLRVHCNMAKLAISHGSTDNEVFSDEQDLPLMSKPN